MRIQVKYCNISSRTHVLTQTGRWTREEHNLFLQGLEMYGKIWKKIAAMIKSRTIVQIRTHAQKHFLKVQKSRPGDVRPRPHDKLTAKKVNYINCMIYHLMLS